MSWLITRELVSFESPFLIAPLPWPERQPLLLDGSRLNMVFINFKNEGGRDRHRRGTDVDGGAFERRLQAGKEAVMNSRRGLVVVRCGDESLHHGWLSADRDWDLAISSFSKNTERTYEEADYVHRYRGGKWDGLYSFFRTFPETLEKYDFFWLPDDDIAASSADISMMFAMMRKYGFQLAQPSLSGASFLSHLIVLRNPAFEYRNVNFVELMVPLLSRSLLTKTLPLFAGTKSGFGIDFIWQRFVENPRREVAILDNVAVTHTRPVGGALHKMMQSEGALAARQEQDKFLAPYGGIITVEATFGGRLKSGQTINNRYLAASLAAVGWMCGPSGKRGFVAPISEIRFLWWALRHWAFAMASPLNVEKIKPVY